MGDTDSLLSTIDSTESSSISSYSNSKIRKIEGVSPGGYGIGSKLAALKEQRMMNKKKDIKGSASRHQSDVDWVNLQLGVNSEEKESAGKEDNGGDVSDDDCYTKTTPTPSPIARDNRITTPPPSTSHTLS